MLGRLLGLTWPQKLTRTISVTQSEKSGNIGVGEASRDEEVENLPGLCARGMELPAIFGMITVSRNRRSRVVGGDSRRISSPLQIQPLNHDQYLISRPQRRRYHTHPIQGHITTSCRARLAPSIKERRALTWFQPSFCQTSRELGPPHCCELSPEQREVHVPGAIACLKVLPQRQSRPNPSPKYL